MKVDDSVAAIPWLFTKEEQAIIRGMLGQPMVVSYLQSLKHMALTNSTLEPLGTTANDLIASNAYVAGQEYILDSLLSTDVYIPHSKGE